MEPEQMEQVCDTLEKQELESEEEMAENEAQEDKVQVYMTEEEHEEDGEEEKEAKGLTDSDAETDDGEAKWQPEEEEEEEEVEMEPEEQQNLKQEMHQNFEEAEEQNPPEENLHLNEEEEQYSSKEKGMEEECPNHAEEKQTLEEEEEKWQNCEEEGETVEEQLQNRGEEGQTSEEENQVPELEEQQNETREEAERVEPKPEQNEETEAPREQEAGQGNEQEVEVEEQQTSARAIPSSLSFAFLEDESTKAVLRASRTLVVLKGLPGSGRSHLASAIKENYGEACSLLSADDYGVKPDDYGASEEGHKALDQAVLACLTSGVAVVVVDDTNHAVVRLAALAELAERHRYCAMFLEPRTEWSKDVEQLVRKSQRGLDRDRMQALKTSLEETSLPLFFGWFVCHPFEENLRSIADDFLRNLVSLEAFGKNITDFKGDAEKDVDLKEYFHDKGLLHCTTKFCEYGKADGAKEYAENQVVKENYGRVSQLALSALFVTPRTLGATVALTEEQLQLWPASAEEEGASQGGSAHITLGCAEGTGPELAELGRLRQRGQEGETVQDTELGSLAYLGEGTWVLGLREPFLVAACFSSFYGHREQEQEQEEEEEEKKKKKKKCIIQ